MIWSHSNRMHWTNNELGVAVDVLQDDEGQWLLKIAGSTQAQKFNHPLDAMDASKGLVEQYNAQKERTVLNESVY